MKSNFFDNIFIRIYMWYESFNDGASEFSTKLLISFIQLMLVANILAFLNYFVLITRVLLNVLLPVIGLIFLYFAIRRYNKSFILELKSKRIPESKYSKILYGVFIVSLLIIPLLSFIIIFRHSNGYF